MQKKVVVIGSGFAGLSAACCLAKDGCKVTVIEKLDQPGGRARQLKRDGFTFDRIFPPGTKQHEVFDYGVKE